MIVTEKVDIKSNKTKQYYLDKGYILDGSYFRDVKIEDLHKGSEMFVECVCDVCSKKTKIMYVKYLKNINNGGFYACSSKCSTKKKEMTLQKNYGEGVTNPMKSIDIKNKVNNNVILYKNDYYENLNFIKYLSNNTYLVMCDNGKNHNFVINRYLLYSRYTKNAIVCTVCNNPENLNKSYSEIHIGDYISKFGIDVVRSERGLGFELDIYLPEYDIAIEFNGLYHHSERFKSKEYHLNKTLVCEKNNIKLIHIWEDEWDYNNKIVKSILLNRLYKISNKIYARCCKIDIIKDNETIKNFLNCNHIDGYCGSYINIGLYHNNDLVFIMCFNKKKSKEKNIYELIRFCNKTDYIVVGAVSKLFKFFIKNYEYDKIISYSDYRMFIGGVYEKLGFVKKSLSKPNYYWIVGRYRKHVNKQNLIKEGYDSNKTESEIMHGRGYFRLYSCGQYRWEYDK